MSDVVIRVEGLGKKFKLGTSEPYYRLSEAIVGLAKNAVTLPARVLSGNSSPKAARTHQQKPSSDFWALKDINFEIRRGDVVGLVGRNGAGKSTLLKILSQITEPTEGRFGIKGQVASLLEVGTGFHPELTGRENLFLSGSILGMSKAEIRRKFDEIVEFAGIEQFLDTPVKRYSSGMQVRLGFAIAAHLDPEILIVDEVLAVGDAEFQKKCLGKMGEVSKSGRTILFVSHSAVAIKSMCHKAILLERGRVISSGSVESTMQAYADQRDDGQLSRRWSLETAPGSDDLRLLSASVEWDRSQYETLTVNTPFELSFQFHVLKEGSVYNPSVLIWRNDGTPVLNTFTGSGCWSTQGLPKGTFTSRVRLPGGLFNNGYHRIDLMLVKDRGHVMFRNEDLLGFDIEDVSDAREGWYGEWIGAVRPNLIWDGGRDNEYAERSKFSS